MDIALDEALHFDALTSRFDTGAATDADSTPTWAIYEEDTDTAVQSGNFTKRTSLTGNYRASVTLSAANGFEAGKWYNVIGSATVNSIAGKGIVMRFRVVPAESAAGVPKVDVTHFGGNAGTFASGIPAASLTAAAIQAIWDIATSSLTTVGSIGKAILDNWTTLLTRLSSSRAGYLDNLNVGGPVASQADINALNQSASRRLIITSVQQFERPESGDSAATFTIEARTYDGDGAATNADSTPTLTATGTVTGSLAANLSSATNPATGVYRWTYTVASSHAIEQIRFDLSATMSSTFTLSHYAQVVNFVATTFTAADRTKLEALNSDWADGGRLDLILDSRASQTSVDDVPNNSEFNARTLVAASYATAATLGSPAGASIAADIAAVKTDTGNLVTRITSTLFAGITYLSRWLGSLAGKTADSTTLTEIQATTAGAGYDNTTDSLQAVSDQGGGGGGGGDATAANQLTIIGHLEDIKGTGFSEATDSLPAIRDALPASSGAGAFTLTITVNDGATALQNATVRLTEGVTALTATTNASGQAVFSVDAATWAVAITKDGYSFTPTTKVVAGTGSQTYSMTAVSITPPASATQSTVVVTIRNSAGTALKDVSVSVRMKTAPTGGGGASYVSAWLSYKADDSGVVTMALIRSAKYELQIAGFKSIHEFTPTTSTFEIPDLVAV